MVAARFLKLISPKSTTTVATTTRMNVVTTTMVRTTGSSSYTASKPTPVSLPGSSESPRCHDQTTVTILAGLYHKHNLSQYHLPPKVFEKICHSPKNNIHAVANILNTLYSYQHQEKARHIKPEVLYTIIGLVTDCQQPEIVDKHIQRKAAEWSYGDPMSSLVNSRTLDYYQSIFSPEKDAPASSSEDYELDIAHLGLSITKRNT